MTETGSEQSATTWPLIPFAFQVLWDGKEIIFQEVTGLNSETQVIEYKGGSSPVYSTTKMPGIKKFGNVTLKKGTFKGDKTLWDSYDLIRMNTHKRVTITINLLDEANAVVMTWVLLNAFPCKITVTDMKSGANEIAVETMELAHEGMSISK